MTVQVHRVFKKDNTLPINVGHYISVVADENRASFAVPKIENVYDFKRFNQAVINVGVPKDGPKPNTPEAWSEIALLNLLLFDVFLTDEDYATFEEAMEQETIKVTEAWYLRNSETIS